MDVRVDGNHPLCQERMKKHAEGFKTSVEEQRRQRAKAQKRKQEERLKKWEGLSFDRPPPPEYNGEHRSESIVADPYAARAAGPGAIVRPLDRAAQSRPRASPADVMNRVREHEQMLASAMEAIRGGGSSHDPHDEGHAVVSNIESPSSSQQQYAENTGVRRHAHSRDTHSRGSRRTNDSPRRGSSSRSEASSRRAESDDERQGNGAVFTGAEFPPGEVLVSPSQLHRGRESVSSVDSLDAESESRIQDTPQRTHGWGAPEQGTASDPVSPAKATGDADDDDSGESDGVDEGYHQYSARNQFATDRQPSSASTTRRTHNRPRSKETRNEQGPPPNRFGWSGSEPRIPHRSVQRPKESRPSGPRRPRPNRARVDDTPPARPKEMPSVRVSWAQPRSESQEPYRSAAEPTMSVSSRGHDGHDDDGRRVRRNNNERGRHRAEVIDYEIKSARTPTDNEIELLWDAVRKGLQGHRGEPAPSSAQHSNRTPRSREAPDSRGSGGQRAETALARARDVQRNFDKKYTWEDEAAAQGKNREGCSV